MMLLTPDEETSELEVTSTFSTRPVPLKPRNKMIRINTEYTKYCYNHDLLTLQSF